MRSMISAPKNSLSQSLRSSLLLLGVGLLGCLLFSGCAAEKPIPISTQQNSKTLAKGRSLVQGLAACGFCHGEKPDPTSTLVGGQLVYDRYGELYAPNITPSESGIGQWSTREVMRAIKRSLDRDEEKLSIQVHSGYNWMSQEDVLAIASYLRSLPPIENEVERRTIGTIDRYTTGLLEKYPGASGYVPSLRREGGVEYGRYLLENVARCDSCHNSPGDLMSSSEYLSGGRTVRTEAGTRVAPNINGSKVYGLGDWKEKDIVTFLQTGQTPDGRFIDTQFCPTPFYRNADQSDLQALARYLKNLEDG